MNTLTYNGKLFVNNELVNIDDFFDRNLFENAIRISRELEEFRSPFINNVFLSYIHNKILPYLGLISLKEINHVKVSSIDEEALYLISVSIKSNIPVEVNKLHLFFFRNKLLIVSIGKLVKYYLGSIFLLLKYIFKNQNKNQQEYNKEKTPIFIHSAASYKVFKQYFSNSLKDYNLFLDFFTVNTKKITDDYFPLTIHITPLNLIVSIFYVLFHSTKEFILLHKELLKVFGKNSLATPLSFCAERIPHYFLNKFSIEKIFKRAKFKVIYSGEKESRWGIILEDFCKKYNIHSICVPHGLQYGLHFPHSIFGAEIICFSENEVKSLTSNYKYKLIKYNRDFPQKLFAYNNTEKNKEKKIVFFTEGRDYLKDESILNFLLVHFESIHIKLHPNDNINNYQLKSENYIILTDFVQSITNNICIARNSTILFEALYNNSKSFSVLLNAKDLYYSEYMYPTLSDKRITKIFSLQGLVEEINNTLK